MKNTASTAYNALTVAYMPTYTALWLERSKKCQNDTLDALEEHAEHEDDYQTNSNW